MKRRKWTRAKKERTLRKVFIYSGLSAGILLIAGAVYAVGFSPLGRVDSIAVEGIRLTNKEEVVDALEKKIKKERLFAKVLDTGHILFWKNDTHSIEKKLPIVEGVEVQRDIRERTISIEVKEKQVHGVWCGTQACWAYDDKGKIFAKTANVSGYLIQKIEDEEQEGKIGMKILENKKWFENIQKVLGELQGNAVVKSRARREWEVETPKGTRILFSLDGAPENLTAIIGELLEKRPLGNDKIIDFRIPDKIYIK